jgi:hypothetical protein
MFLHEQALYYRQSMPLRVVVGLPLLVIHEVVTRRLLWYIVEGGVQPFNYLFRCKENSSVPAS